MSQTNEVTSYDEKMKYTIQAKLTTKSEEGTTNGGTTQYLDIEATSMVDGAQYAGSVQCLHWDPQDIFALLTDNKYAIEINSTEKITLKIGFFKWPLEKKRENEISSLKAKITYLEKIIEKKLHPIVCSLTSTQALDGTKVVWNKELIPLDNKFFTLSQDKKGISIREEGIYRIDVKFLIAQSIEGYFSLMINSFNAMYGFGTAKGGTWQDTSLNLIWPVKKDDVISIAFPSGFYVSDGTHHYICITKL